MVIRYRPVAQEEQQRGCRGSAPRTRTRRSAAPSITSTKPISAKGTVLPRMNSSGRDRRDHDLLHRADLLLADHGHAGQQQRDQRDHDDDHAGHVEVAAFQVLVEPRPGAQIELARAGAAALRARSNALSEDLLRNIAW